MAPLSKKGKRSRASAKTGGRTVLIVDIENGSAGAALVQVFAQGSPKLFAEFRSFLPLQRSVSAETLFSELEKALRSVLTNASTVAARMRANESVASMGEVTEAAVFIAAPWTTLRAGAKALDWEFEPKLVSLLHGELESLFGDIPVSLHPFGEVGSWTAGGLFPSQREFLLCSLTGECMELGLVRDRTLSGWASIPVGHHHAVRTLSAHAGLTPAEAHSALNLSRYGTAPALERYAEPLSAATGHVLSSFKEGAAEILSGAPSGILVLGQGPASEWLARAIAGDLSLLELFPRGGSVRTLRHSHLMPHFAAHAAQPDVILMLEALFINGI